MKQKSIVNWESTGFKRESTGLKYLHDSKAFIE